MKLLNILLWKKGNAFNESEQRSGARIIFVFFCAYYVLATYLIPSSGVVEKFSIVYFLLVIPGWVYIAISSKFLFSRPQFLARLWWIFILVALFVSFVRLDFSLAYNSLYLGLLAIVIINSGGFLNTRELNILFLMTIIGSFLIYILGITDYGFLPYLSGEETCHKSLAFRVSLFRVLSESAAFSFFVLLLNIFKPVKQGSWIRYICIFLSIYFIVFSGIRSAILTLLIISPLLIFQLLRLKKINLRSVSYLICSFFLIGYILIQSSLLSVNSVRNLVSNQLLRIDSCSAIAVLQPTAPRTLERASDSFLIKSIGDFVGVKNFSSSWLEQTINRHCSAGYQLKLFLDHPLIGNSVVRPNSIEEEARVGCSHEAIQRFCDACVLATYWLSKGGIAGVIFTIIYFATFVLALLRKSMFGVTTLFSFGVILQGWGVMFMPYNFTFYMLMSVVPIISFTKRRS